MFFWGFLYPEFNKSLLRIKTLAITKYWHLAKNMHFVNSCTIVLMYEYSDYAGLADHRRTATATLPYSNWWWWGALCAEMGFYVDISRESRCSSEIKI